MAPPKISIIIDNQQYFALDDTMTGAQLRQLANPPIGADRDVWLDAPGPNDDLIGDAQSVPLKPGTRFFSAPKTINPGARDAAR